MTRSPCAVVVAALLLNTLVGWAMPAANIENIPRMGLPGKLIGNIDRANFNEPSGIVFHAKRNTLFVVGDEGDICEIQTDGSLVKQQRIRHADFEGITYDPSTGLLYIAIEGAEEILEIHPDNFKVLREFNIGRVFQGKTVLKAGGQGIEAITFVPDSKHPEGGTFYVANQCFSLQNTEDPSAILEVELPLRSKPGENAAAKIIKHIPLPITDLSGLQYSSEDDHLYLISDDNNILLRTTKTGTITKVYTLPGKHQEGVTVDKKGYLYLTQDSGGNP